MLAHMLLAFLFPQLPQNDTTPQRVGSHRRLVLLKEFCNLCFDWLHSGLSNDSKDRLRNGMKIAKGLRLLKFMLEYLFGSLPISGETRTKQKIDHALIKGSSSTCVGYHDSKRLKQSPF